jgi:hypothetical protein
MSITNKRNRGSLGVVPLPTEIIDARGELSQSKAASLIYTTQARWSNYETGKSRMHPSAWELFNIKKVNYGKQDSTF